MPPFFFFLLYYNVIYCFKQVELIWNVLNNDLIKYEIVYTYQKNDISTTKIG